MTQPARPDLVEMRVTGDMAVAVIIPSKLDDSNAEPISQQLSALAEVSEQKNLDVDLGNVRYLDGGAMGKIVGLHRKVRAAGGRLRLLNVEGPVYEVFQVTKLDTILDIQRKVAG
jgi:anti-sigma B factor antagonist